MLWYPQNPSLLPVCMTYVLVDQEPQRTPVSVMPWKPMLATVARLG